MQKPPNEWDDQITEEPRGQYTVMTLRDRQVWANSVDQTAPEEELHGDSVLSLTSL